jgi:hypothetical protein
MTLQNLTSWDFDTKLKELTEIQRNRFNAIPVNGEESPEAIEARVTIQHQIEQVQKQRRREKK